MQSNLARLAAAGARRLGMDIHIQLEDRVDGAGELNRASGNPLLDRVLGATLRACATGDDEEAADAALERRATALAAEDRTPYVIHSGPGHLPLGGLGYVAAAVEVLDRARTLGIRFDAVVCASGSALTHAGILVGMRALGARAGRRHSSGMGTGSVLGSRPRPMRQGAEVCICSSALGLSDRG